MLKRERDGHAVVSFKASALFQVEREVLRWGDKVEVVAPAVLRKQVRESAQRIVASHC